MANIKFKLVQHDRMPDISLSLTDEVTGLPIDLSDPATAVRMYLRTVGSKTLKETLLLPKLYGRVTAIDEETGAQTIDAAAPYNVAGKGGRCAIQWSATSLDTAGNFEGEIEVTYPDGRKQTWLDLLQFAVREDFA
jgi:hypothetical protein